MPTIHFLEDWNKYSAKPDFRTKNESYLDYCKLLQAMGVKNNAFPLALFDQSLIGIDPHDPELSQPWQLRVVNECRRNFWYYFREVAKAPPRSGLIGDQITANRGNIAYWWLFYLNVTLYLIMTRQTGKSLTGYANVNYLMNIRCVGTQINWLTKDHSLRQNTVIDIKRMEEQMPHYLRIRRKNDVANTEQLHYSALDNRFIVHVPQNSEKDANKVGRGFTSPIHKNDEAPFQNYLDIMLPAILTAGTAAREIAIEKGEPACQAFTTTAGNLAERSGFYMFSLVDNAAEWTERMFDCKNKAELYQMVQNHSKSNDIDVAIILSHKQLGKTDKWLYETMKTVKVVGEAADRDFFNRWSSGGRSNPLPRETLDKIKKSEKEGYVDNRPGNEYKLWWYVTEDKIDEAMNSAWHVMSMDTSEAIGNDDMTIKFINLETGEVTGAGSFNTTNTLKFSQWVAKLFVIFPKFVCNPERRSTGSGIIDNLLYILPGLGIDPFKRIFNRVVHEYDTSKERYEDLVRAGSYRKKELVDLHRRYFGFPTSGSGEFSREILYTDILKFAADYGGDKVHHRKTIMQICALEIRNGRVDHPESGHDDLVIAWLLGYWFINRAKNLSYYGIDSSRIMCRARPVMNQSKAQISEALEQDMVRDKIKKLSELMENESNEFILERYERQLNELNNRLILKENEVFSIDDLISKIKEKRKRKNLINRSRSFNR